MEQIEAAHGMQVDVVNTAICLRSNADVVI